jgi:hypothetical protein
MRRLLALVVVAVLVNLPWAHEAWVDHRIDEAGRVVGAELVEHRTVGHKHFVEYRLPASLDPGRHRYSARLDGRHYDRAVAAGTVAVRVVPGHPSYNRPAGEVGGAVFAVAALLGDAVLGIVGAVLWWRRRRWAVRRVRAIDGDLVTFTMGSMTLTARADRALRDGLAVGGRLAGTLSLRPDGDVVPAGPLGTLEHLEGARYRATGRVSDVSRTHADLQLDSGWTLRVRTADVRNRADLRELAAVTGTLEARPGLD